MRPATSKAKSPASRRRRLSVRVSLLSRRQRLALLLIYQTWAFTGIWRAAGRYDGDKALALALAAKAAVVGGAGWFLLLAWGGGFPGVGLWRQGGPKSHHSRRPAHS
ncbi:MAG: hypothetical protein O3A85_06545 [Proteobacteria bacterium]|nr:hypothetical protein [Pseudomonadota bacterium]